MVRFLVIAVSLLAPPAAYAAGNVEMGAVVFKKCAACHNIDQPQDKIGPNLVGIIGRKAASATSFPYSEAMKKAGADGLVWDEKALAQYLAAPKKFIPGNKMSFTGLKDQQDIDNLIEFLHR